MSGGGGGSAARLGIVIPTLDEEDALPKLLDDLAMLPLPVEIVVVDGGSRDGTERIVLERAIRWIPSAPGRSRQMNAGARSLRTPWLLFLHADSRVPAETREALGRWIAAPPPSEAGYFQFRLDARGAWWRGIEWGQRIRERLTGLVYGDQGLVISRGRFERMGGIPEIPIMEDVAVVRRLRQGAGLDRIETPILTSARRYRAEGLLRSPLRNGALLALYTLGVSPHRLIRWYRPRRTEGFDPATVSTPPDR